MNMPVASRTSIISAIACGPIRYFQASMIGFVAAVIGFLVYASFQDTGFEVDYASQIDHLLLTAVVGIGVSLVVAVIYNFIIGRRVQHEQELIKELFSGPELPPPMPRPDVPGYVLVADHDARRPGAQRSTRLDSSSETV